MEFFFIIAFTEEFLPLLGSNPIVVDTAIGFLFYLRWIFLLFPLFHSTHLTTFFSSSGHWHFLPRSAHLVFGRDFMLSIFLLQSRTNFSSMPNFRLAAELLELSDANLTTCNLKLAEYFIHFTFDNILLHVTQAKKTNREVRHLALPVLFSQLELIYT